MLTNANNTNLLADLFVPFELFSLKVKEHIIYPYRQAHAHRTNTHTQAGRQAGIALYKFKQTVGNAYVTPYMNMQHANKSNQPTKCLVETFVNGISVWSILCLFGRRLCKHIRRPPLVKIGNSIVKPNCWVVVY